MMRPAFLLFGLLAVLCCSKKASLPSPVVPTRDTTTAVAGGAKTYLALGDSYTIGQLVTTDERFPAQTVALLKQQGINVADPVYIAQTGWTTANLQAAIDAQAPPPTYDVVSLLIGVNDQYQQMDTSGYAVRFTALLEKAIALAKGKKTGVFVVSIPDYSVTPFVPASNKAQVSTEVGWFNAINKRITEAYNISYTDITPASQEAANNPSLIAGDGLHPSGLEYKVWAEMLAPKMKAVLK